MSTGEQIRRQWLSHRTVLQDILQRVPDEQFDFKPWAGGMTLSKLSVHMAVVADMFSQAVATGEFGAPTDGGDVSNAAQVRQFVDEMTTKTGNTLASLSDEQLERILEGKRFGRDLPGKVWLNSMRDHEIHHKGQMFVYARMVGVEDMPFFVNTQVK